MPSEPSPSGLSDRLANQLANFRHFWLGYDDSAGDGAEALPALTLYRSGAPSQMYNGILRVSPGADLESARAQAVRRLEGVPSVWWVGPDSDPGTRGYLRSHGLSEIGAMAVMEIDLSKVTGAAPPTGLSISAAVGTRDIEAWVHAYAPSMGLPPSALDQVIVRHQARPLEDFVRFEARDGDRIVGTAALLARSRVAGIYVVTTSEPYRGCGLGTALTTAALLAGRDRGLEVGTLQTATAASLYERIGFRTVADYHLFALPPSPQPQPPHRARCARAFQ